MKLTLAALIILAMISMLLAACSITKNIKFSCNLAADCPVGVCQDGYKYTQFDCVNNKCSQRQFFADPCLNHYIRDAECASDSDCTSGGCSNQVCGKKESIKGLITTCEFKEEYSCLESTSCGCVESKCRWEETPSYTSCMDKYR